jgi:Tfp pilus assembly protein PilV
MSGLFRGKKHERGDTIVEVMISLIIISSVIVGAFVVSRISSRNIRNSEEHSQALQMLQGQVEMLKAYGDSHTGSANLLPTSGTFCMKSDGNPGPASNCANLNTYYTLTVEQTAVAKDGFAPTYTFTVTWPAQDGSISNENIVYRPQNLSS